MEKRIKSPDVDPKTGLVVSWRCEPKEGISFSLVEVPKKEQTTLLYAKSGLRINLILTPIDSSNWGIIGNVGTDTLVNLGIKVFKQRQDDYTPPIVTIEDIERFRREHGKITDLSGKRTYFNIGAILPITNVAGFLKKVWSEPIAKLEGISENDVPKFSLEESNNGCRILPQKTISPQKSSGTSLTVEKYNPWRVPTFSNQILSYDRFSSSNRRNLSLAR